MKIFDLIDFCDMENEEWDALYELACDIKANPEKYSDACRSKLMATLFYEPSTRTQMSFQSAMLRLGGSIIGFSDPKTSSVSKGETLRDTIKIISGYTDIVVIRSPLEGAAFAASMYSRVPVINAGDGSHLHPTQTLTDLMTIRLNKGTLNGLNIGFCGDLLNGRTVHSLLGAFAKLGKGNTFYLISTDELKIPKYQIPASLAENNTICEVSTIEECIDKLDVLYMTRIQRERFASQEQYEAQSGIYILDQHKMDLARKDLIVLHPLPKVDEIDYEIDDDDRALYFEQARNGMFVRMALVLSMVGTKEYKKTIYPLPERRFCTNPRCITNHERYLPELVENGHCKYCGHPAVE